MQWSAKRQRKVLNSAMASAITPEMIRAADFAVSNGFCGSLSRRTSSRHDVPAAPPRPSPRVSASDLSQRLRSPSGTSLVGNGLGRTGSSAPAEGVTSRTFI